MDQEEIIKRGKEILSKVMTKIKAGNLSASEKSGHYLIPSDSGEENQALFWIPTKGCSYALSKTGGCTMCDFGGCSKRLTEEELVNEFISQLEHPEIKGSSVINFGGQGSFFDDEEFSQSLRAKLIDEIAKRDWINVFVCESRPEFITREKFKQHRERLKRKFLELGVGIESTNPLIREGIVNKGLNKKDYENMINWAREFEIWLSLHIILKPNVLTEKEAIEDAIKTTKDLLKNVNETHPTLRIILMVMNIKQNTLVGWAYKKGLYKPPLLWSCVEILKGLTEEERSYVKVLGFDTGVKPIKYSSNEDGTTKILIEALKKFDRNHEIKPLLEIEKKYQNSPSHKKWEKRLNQKAKPLKERLIEFYKLLIKENPGIFKEERTF